MAQKLLQYEVLERIGEGARSVIYSVVDPDSKKVYALKHVQRAETKDLRFIEQMETEFEISKQFTHPNLRRTYELKINKTMLLKTAEAFLLMEMVEGKPLDVRMPNVNGEQFCRFIKSNSLFSGIKVLLCSGEEPEELKRICREAGADGYVAKDSILSKVLAQQLP